MNPLIRFGAMLAAALLVSCAASSSPTPMSAETTPSSTPTATATSPPPTSTPVFIEASTVAEFEQIEAEVEALRGLEPSQPIARLPVNSSGMAEVLESNLRQRYSPQQAELDALVLSALGLIGSDFDLWSFYLDLVQEDLPSSFYDHQADTLYVLADTDPSALSRLTYVHHYAVALLDQVFGLDENLELSNSSCRGSDDRCPATRALVQGDASLLEEQWLRLYASDDDIDSLIGLYNAFESEVFVAAPDYLQALFLFPYREGTEFVRWHYRRGGWAAVDEQYGQPPPATEAILHPLRPEGDSPVRLDLSSLTAEDLGDGWVEFSRERFGEYNFRRLLALRLEADRAEAAAAGWGGDSLIAFRSGDSVALVLIQTWDTIRDSQDAFLAWRDWGEDRFGERSARDGGYSWSGEDYAVQLERGSNQSLWLLAPDEATIEDLRDSIEFPAPRVR